MKIDNVKGNIALIGVMGGGKTTIGRALAARLGRVFADTDEMAIEAAGKPIAQIFKEEGEERFREIESEMIERACQMENAVISTGGGAVLEPENALALKEACVVVYLRVSPKAAWERVKGDGARPLISGDTDKAKRDRLRLIMRLREPIYAALADFVIDTSRLGVDEAVDKLIEYQKILEGFK